MSKELKEIKILKEIRNIETGYDHHLKHRFDEAIKELEQYEQNFKQKEFEYRTQCQSLVSAGRVETNEVPLGSRILLLNENEKVFWQEAYIHAMKISSRLVSANVFPLLASYSVADDAIEDLRLRLGSNLKKELINDN